MASGLDSAGTKYSHHCRKSWWTALPYLLDKLTEQSVSIDLEAESNCGHPTPGSIPETAKSIKLTETLGRYTFIITPHHEFSLQLNEIIQTLILLFVDLLT